MDAEKKEEMISSPKVEEMGISRAKENSGDEIS